MMKICKNKKAGFSLSELLIAATVGLFLVGVVMSVWFFVYRNWSAENIRTRSRVNLEIAAETMREDLRLASSTYFSGSPSGAAVYTGISVPSATKDANGFYTLSADNIVWDKSIIYHLYDNSVSGNTELRRTVFESNTSILSDSTLREAQLDSVITQGDATAASNGANATTKVIIPRTTSEQNRQDIDLEIKGRALGFNAYSATQKKTNVSFGCIELSPGAHDFKFEVTDQDPLSVGYAFGLDTISISPSGCAREPEIYTIYSDLGETIFGSSGETIVAIGPDALWSGNYFLEFGAGAVGSFLTLRLYLDLYRESNFLDSQRDNAILTGDQLYIKLPDINEGGTIVWQADEPTGGSIQDYGGGSLEGKTIRIILKNGNLTDDGDMFRIRFDSYSTEALMVENVFLDVKDDDGSEDPTKIKYDPLNAGELDDYLDNHIQLFFSDPDTGDISSSANIDPNDATNPRTTAFTNWGIYDLDPSKEYVLTYHITDDSNYDNVSFWENSTLSINSYLLDDNIKEYCDPTDPSKYVEWNPVDYTADPDIYAVGLFEIWKKEGSITSKIYDTKQADPAYNQVTWSEHVPANSDVLVSVRESDDPTMLTAAAWSTITGSSAKPNNISGLGTGQYVQFKADLLVSLGWTCKDHATENVTIVDYCDGTIICSVCGEELVPRPAASVDFCPWIDNVTIDFPGENKVYEISGYMLQNSNYGIFSLSIDGQPLSKGLEVELSASETVLNKSYQDSINFAVESRNTGK